MIRLSRPQSRAGFTLVELMVVITIIIIMSVITYAPYNYYSNRAKVRIGAETIEQILNRARLLSVNGHLFPGTKQNAHVGVVFTPHSNAPDILLFPYVSWALNDLSFTATNNAVKESFQSIEPGVVIGSIKTITSADSDPSLAKALILFLAPDGVAELYTENSTTRKPEKNSATGVTIIIGINGTTKGPLSKEITIPLR